MLVVTYGTQQVSIAKVVVTDWLHYASQSLGNLDYRGHDL